MRPSIQTVLGALPGIDPRVDEKGVKVEALAAPNVYQISGLPADHADLMVGKVGSDVTTIRGSDADGNAAILAHQLTTQLSNIKKAEVVPGETAQDPWELVILKGDVTARVRIKGQVVEGASWTATVKAGQNFDPADTVLTVAISSEMPPVTTVALPDGTAFPFATHGAVLTANDNPYNVLERRDDQTLVVENRDAGVLTDQLIIAAADWSLSSGAVAVTQSIATTVSPETVASALKDGLDFSSDPHYSNYRAEVEVTWGSAQIALPQDVVLPVDLLGIQSAIEIDGHSLALGDTVRYRVVDFRPEGAALTIASSDLKKVTLTNAVWPQDAVGRELEIGESPATYEVEERLSDTEVLLKSPATATSEETNWTLKGRSDRWIDIRQPLHGHRCDPTRGAVAYDCP